MLMVLLANLKHQICHNVMFPGITFRINGPLIPPLLQQHYSVNYISCFILY